MVSKQWLFNISLGVVAAIFGVQAYRVWTKTEPVPVSRPSEPHPSERITLASKRMAPESAYQVIAEKNVFSPDRSEQIPKESTAKPEVKQADIAGKKIQLYGVILTDTFRAALINNPEAKSDERPNKWVKVGDSVAGLTVEQIRKDSIVLAETGKKYEILLYDKNKARSPEAVQKESQPTVVITESQKKPTEPSKPDGSVSKTAEVPDDNDEIIHTPFGTVKRKKK